MKKTFYFVIAILMMAVAGLARAECGPMDYAEFKDMTKEQQIEYFCKTSKAADGYQSISFLPEYKFKAEKCRSEAVRIADIFVRQGMDMSSNAKYCTKG